MRRIDWSSLDAAGRKAALVRPARRADPAVAAAVADVFAQVEVEGGEAVRRLAVRFDRFEPRRIVIDALAAARARADLAPADSRALSIAADNVRVFHEATRPQDTAEIETTPGVRSRLVWRPLASAGLYVPGGTAPLFSSLLMLAIPAQVAGVRRRVATTPPMRDGGAHPAMILAAALSGLEELWLLGGAQAIAAMTFGCSLPAGDIPACDKLFGPGNAYVAEAKKRAAALAGGPAVDMPAGPSELMVVADGRADPALVAADLLSQAEHDADAQVVLVSDSDRLIEAVLTEVEARVADLPRAATARASLADGRAIRVADLDMACAVADLYAPEHLSLHTEDAAARAATLNAAGAVFVGAFAAETLGDYAAGPSHVLPTDGAARAFGGVTTASFMTSMSVQTVTRAGAQALAPVAARLARLEGLEAHARAADLRSAA